MNDKQLIEYCGRLCDGKGLFHSTNINRMIELAGNPRAYPPATYGFHTMPEQMRILVDLARKRMARPAGGLKIEVGRSYRDVNGEVRKVVDMPPHHRSCGVKWVSATDSGYARLEKFRDDSVEEIKP